MNIEVQWISQMVEQFEERVEDRLEEMEAKLAAVQEVKTDVQSEENIKLGKQVRTVKFLLVTWLPWKLKHRKSLPYWL